MVNEAEKKVLRYIRNLRPIILHDLGIIWGMEIEQVYREVAPKFKADLI